MPFVFPHINEDLNRFGRRKYRRSWKNSAFWNSRTFTDYYMRMKEICLNEFEWVGLPDTVEQRFLQRMLFEKGYCVYFRDTVLGDLVLDCQYTQELDVYGNPIRRMAISQYNGYHSDWLDETNSVMIYNNYLRTASAPTVEILAHRIADAQRTMDVNTLAQKTPVLIRCEEAQVLTMKNAFEQVDENNVVIFGNKNSLSQTPFEAVNTSAPFVSLDIAILKRQYWNEFLSYRGIENVSSEKKERLVTEEVSSTMGGIIAQRNTFLQAQQEAAEKINKMFGTNIEVKYKVDIEALKKTEDELEVMESVEVHNDFGGDSANGVQAESE